MDRLVEEMAGGGRMTHQVGDGRRGRPAVQGVPFIRGPVPHLGPPAFLLEEEIEFQMVEIQRLLERNRRLADDHMALQRHIAALNRELHQMNLVNAGIRADKDAQVTELIKKVRNLESGMRAYEPLKSEALQLRVELAKSQADNQQIPAMRQDVEGLKQELMHARSACEFEKKMNAELLGQRQAMEQSIIALAREMEKLQPNGGSAEGRLFYGGDNGIQFRNPEGPFPSSSGGAHGPHLGTTSNAPVHGTGSGPWVVFQNPHPPRH